MTEDRSLSAPEGRSEAAYEPLTLTHARLRWMQGDLRGARRVISAILVQHPEDGGARDLLRRLEEPPPPASPSARRGITPHVDDDRKAVPRSIERRVARLRDWLRRIER